MNTIATILLPIFSIISTVIIIAALRFVARGRK